MADSVRTSMSHFLAKAEGEKEGRMPGMRMLLLAVVLVLLSGFGHPVILAVSQGGEWADVWDPILGTLGGAQAAGAVMVDIDQATPLDQLGDRIPWIFGVHLFLTIGWTGMFFWARKKKRPFMASKIALISYAVALVGCALLYPPFVNLWSMSLTVLIFGLLIASAVLARTQLLHSES